MPPDPKLHKVPRPHAPVAEKIGQGVILETHPRDTVDADDALEEEKDRLRNKRDAARGTAVLGTGMMFLASFSAGMAVGGALMLLFGGVGAFVWGRRLRALEDDPWNDSEIDAWEREQLKD